MVDRLTEERLAELEALTSTHLWRMSLKVEEAASLIAEVRVSRAGAAARTDLQTVLAEAAKGSDHQ